MRLTRNEKGTVQNALRQAEDSKRRSHQAYRPVEPQRGVHRAGGAVGTSCSVRGVRPHSVECHSERCGIPCRADSEPACGNRLGGQLQCGQRVSGRKPESIRPAGGDSQGADLHGGRHIHGI